MNVYDDPVKCIKCDAQATWLVNELPYCAHHAEPRARWLLEHEGVVSRLRSSLGFTREPSGDLASVCLWEMSPRERVCFLVRARESGLIDDWALWEILSRHNGSVPHSDATEIYRRLGFVPHVGYPLTKEISDE